jgi:hypothetical protein
MAQTSSCEVSDVPKGQAARRPAALPICLGAVLAAFKKIKNRGKELKDLLQRQGITEIAASKRTHFCAEKAAIGAERGGISKIFTARCPLAQAVWRDRCRKLARRGADLQVGSSGDSHQPAHLKAVATQIRGTKPECL